MQDPAPALVSGTFSCIVAPGWFSITYTVAADGDLRHSVCDENVWLRIVGCFHLTEQSSFIGHLSHHTCMSNNLVTLVSGRLTWRQLVELYMPT